MDHNYFGLCDGIARDYFNGDLRGKLSPALLSNGSKPRFDLEYLPEPYLPLSKNILLRKNDPNRILHFLYANPGKGLDDIQIREKLPNEAYSTLAHKLVASYDEYFRARIPNGFRRIEISRSLAKECDFDGACQMDCIPWHSVSLPRKNYLPRLIEDDELTRTYCKELADYLKDCSVISVDGAGRSISRATFECEWMQFKARLMGLDISTAIFFPIIIGENGNVTAGALTTHVNRNVKVMYCVCGNNNLPAAEGQNKLIRLLKAQI